MKQISPVAIWNNGQSLQANWLQVNCSNDNLVDTAIFNYTLICVQPDSSPIQLNQGQLIMTGSEYDSNWNTNDQAYNWVAFKLNLTIIP